MKKVMDGKLYNTESATLIGSFWNNLSITDFNYLKKELYRTKSGNYFLYCHGGANTAYAERVGYMMKDGETIHPMTFERARSWAEKNLSTNDYLNHFDATDPDDDNSISASFLLSKQAINLLNNLQSTTGQNKSDIVDNLIISYVPQLLPDNINF